MKDQKIQRSQIALVGNLKEILWSRRSILAYPERLSSSIVFEAGLALAYGEPTVWFVRDRSHLLYLMREADQASGRSGKRLPVRILRYSDFDDLIRSFEVNGTRLFEMPRDGGND